MNPCWVDDEAQQDFFPETAEDAEYTLNQHDAFLTTEGTEITELE